MEAERLLLDSGVEILYGTKICAVTGEAAGIAAAICGSGRVDILSLQKRLIENGVKLHEKDL